MRWVLGSSFFDLTKHESTRGSRNVQASGMRSGCSCPHASHILRSHGDTPGSCGSMCASMKDCRDVTNTKRTRHVHKQRTGVQECPNHAGTAKGVKQRMHAAQSQREGGWAAPQVRVCGSSAPVRCMPLLTSTHARRLWADDVSVGDGSTPWAATEVCRRHRRAASRSGDRGARHAHRSEALLGPLFAITVGSGDTGVTTAPYPLVSSARRLHVGRSPNLLEAGRH